MGQPADLYTILRFYANRGRTPSFTAESFIAFLEKYAKRYMEERADLAPWATDTPRKVHNDLPTLQEAGKCTLSSGERGLVITVNQFFVDLVQQAYKDMEDMPELPYPDETTLKVIIPPSLVRTINIEVDLEGYLAAPQGAPLPLIKLSFPEGSQPILTLSGMIPRKLLEISILKARHYLRAHNNKEYVMHKLAPAFQGKESMLKDALGQLLVRPFDSLVELEKAGDFSFPFWAYFASLVKGDIRKKNDRLPEDLAITQAVQVLEFFNNYYKGKVQKERESENALRNLDLQLEKPPYHYAIEDVMKFTDSKGVPLLGQFAKGALENYIKMKTTDTHGLEQLPELLILRGLSDEHWYIKKSKMLPLCVKLLGETRPRVKSAITQRWFKLMSDYRSDPSMESDADFEKELSELTDSFAPVLSAVLRDKTLALIHDELEGTESGIPEAGRLFYKGALAPMSELYLLSRKDLLIDVKMLLPFWYSMPIFSKIIAFFKGLSQPKPKRVKRDVLTQRPQAAGGDETELPRAGEKPGASAQARKAELKKAARAVEKSLVPEGYSLDDYLQELEERWNRIISPQLKENLTEDVNSLIRDYLRKSSRNLRASTFTPDRIAELAQSLAESPNLLKIPARDSLRMYIQLYMVKLVLKS